MPAIHPRKLALQTLVIAGTVGAGVYLWSRRKSRVSCLSADDSGVIGGISFIEKVVGTKDKNAALPMIISFHPRGSSANEAPTFSGQLEGAYRVIRPNGPLGSGQSRRWIEATVEAPDDVLFGQMAKLLPSLELFARTIAACRPTKGLPIATGWSQGGNMAYLMSNRTDTVSGSVALQGYIPHQMWATGMAPTYGLHTTEDPAYERVKEYWDAMAAGGAELTVATFPGGHSLPNAMAAERLKGLQHFLDQL